MAETADAANVLAWLYTAGVWLRAAGAVVYTAVAYGVVLPVVWVLEHVLAVLSVVFSPVLHVLGYAIHAALLPLRLMAKLETLYIYFSTAVLLGLVAGITLFVVSSLLVPALGMGGSSLNLAAHEHHYRQRVRQRLQRSGLSLADGLDGFALPALSLDSVQRLLQGAPLGPDGDDGYEDVADTPAARTAASFNAQRAEKRALLARQQALLGLPAARRVKGKRKPDGVVARDEAEWGSARDFEPPTPMMGTMILEEDTSSE